MKTNDTNKSVFFRSSLMVILVTTISLNASADNLLKKVLSEFGIGKLAALMVQNTPVISTTNSIYFSSISPDEKKIAEPSQTPAPVETTTPNFTEEQEAPMQIEPWMLELEPHTPPVFNEEIEEPMVIEAWMHEDLRSLNMDQTQEPPMAIEKWMYEDLDNLELDDTEEKPMAIEEWMTEI